MLFFILPMNEMKSSDGPSPCLNKMFGESNSSPVDTVNGQPGFSPWEISELFASPLFTPKSHLGLTFIATHHSRRSRLPDAYGIYNTWIAWYANTKGSYFRRVAVCCALYESTISVYPYLFMPPTWYIEPVDPQFRHSYWSAYDEQKEDT